MNRLVAPLGQVLANNEGLDRYNDLDPLKRPL
jgi:hypothetical protein